MSAGYTPSQRVADEAASLVDELWRTIGGSEPSDAAGETSDDGSGAAPGGSRVRPGGGAPCLWCAIRGRTESFDLSFDPTAIDGLADVVEAAAVGLRAFSVHLAALRTTSAKEPANVPGEAPVAGANRRACACEDSDGEDGVSDGEAG